MANREDILKRAKKEGWTEAFAAQEIRREEAVAGDSVGVKSEAPEDKEN